MSPEAQGQGIAKGMIHSALQLGQKVVEDNMAKGVCTIFVDKLNLSAIGLYETSGIIKLSEEDFVLPNGRGGFSICYRYDLS